MHEFTFWPQGVFFFFFFSKAVGKNEKNILAGLAWALHQWRRGCSSTYEPKGDMPCKSDAGDGWCLWRHPPQMHMARTMSTMFGGWAPSDPKSWRLSSRLASKTQKTFGVPLFQLLSVDNPAQWQTAFLMVFFHSQGPRCRHSTQGQGPQAGLGPVASALGTGVAHIALESDWGWRRRRLHGTVSMSRGSLPVGLEQCGG